MGHWCVDSLKRVSFAKEPYKRDDILQKRPVILRSLLIAARVIDVLHVTHWYVWCDSLICVIWLIDTCVMGLIDTCDVTHWYVSCDSLIRVMWLIDMCHVTHLCDTTHEPTQTCAVKHWGVDYGRHWYVSCDSFVRHVSWYDMSHDSHVYLESFKYWLCKVASISSIHRNMHCNTPYNTYCNTLQQKLQRIRMCWL